MKIWERIIQEENRVTSELTKKNLEECFVTPTVSIVSNSSTFYSTHLSAASKEHRAKLLGLMHSEIRKAQKIAEDGKYDEAVEKIDALAKRAIESFGKAITSSQCSTIYSELRCDLVKIINSIPVWRDVPDAASPS